MSRELIAIQTVKPTVTKAIAIFVDFSIVNSQVSPFVNGGHLFLKET